MKFGPFHIVNPKCKSFAAWGWRFLMGPAYLVEGVVQTLTLSFVVLGAPAWVSRMGVRAHINHLKGNKF